MSSGRFYLRTGDSNSLFTKGNLYKSPKDGYLIDNNGYEIRIVTPGFTDKIAVHTPTQSDWDYVIGKVRDEYYNLWSIKGIDTHIDLSDGCRSGREWYEDNNYYIVKIKQFRDLVKEKVYIRGHKTRGDEVIAKLESLGGVNNGRYNGHYIYYLYFIEDYGEINHSKLPPIGYTEIFLDEPVTEESQITKEQVELNVVEYAKSVNWDFEKIIELLFCRIISKELMILDGDNPSDKAQNIFNKYKPKYESEPDITELGRISEVVGGFVTKSDKVSKPEHYATGIDTFARMEANCSVEECIAFAKGNIDKYNWRKKGQDIEDFDKIIAYANWAKKLLTK